MNNLLEFLSEDDITKTTVFNFLNCNASQARILKKLLQMQLSGIDGVNILNLITNTYKASGAEVLPYLKDLDVLMKLGWIVDTNNSALLSMLKEDLYLSHSFLKLLEGGLDATLPIRAYKDNLEYLKDEFSLIDLIFKTRDAKHGAVTGFKRQIDSRLKLTKIPLELPRITKEFKLNEKERLLLLGLTKLKYDQGNQNYIWELVNILGKNESEKLLISNMLDDKLVRLGLVEVDFVSLGATKSQLEDLSIDRNIYNRIVNIKTKSYEGLENHDLFEIIKPKVSLEEVILPKKTKEMLNVLVEHMDANIHKKLRAWKLVDKAGINARILFHGLSGTGKTLSAKALAKSLHRDLLSLDCSKILSMYVGESEKNVRRVFDEYNYIRQDKKLSPILLLDEADQFLSARGGLSGVDKMHNQMQNIFLEQIERFDGILIATTNLLDSFDSAFSRRFNYKIKFDNPTKENRLKIWELHLPKNAKFDIDKKELLDKLSYFELSGGQISLIVKNTAYKVAARKDSTFFLNDFLESVQNERDGNFDSTKSIGFMLN
ncbi:hypothetical protein BKH43_03225 [Helicobacter sp. 13S00401-1]|uniref:ATP-binding protein n=1 Tax=Helicobacter sp. 13S00401-1 TaxID=1905758 RepID=UPI000BA51173|nr:ATP-binding protein [Helicobacter sp. 13S00401-1]PAF50887.1 hypothetical protein BKH43_03225 [Helicobacter sp. 13S00401-1]